MSVDTDDTSGNDEFDAAFDEAARLSTGEVAASTDGGADEDEQHDETAQERKASPAADDDRDEPARSPQQQSAQPKAQAEGSDEVTRLREQLQEALHRERSASGRIGERDRQANELRQQVSELTAQLEQLQNQQKQAAKPATEGDVDDILKDSPELSAAIERRIAERVAPLQTALDAANSRLAEVGEQAVTAAQQVQPLAEQHRNARIVSTQQLLDQRFTPQWRKDVQSVEFQAWLAGRSEAVQQIFKTSSDVGETSEVLGMFYASQGKRPGQGAAASAAAGAKDERSESPNPETAQQRRLRQSAGISPSAGRVMKTEPDKDDFDGAWDHFAALSKQGHHHDRVR